MVPQLSENGSLLISLQAHDDQQLKEAIDGLKKLFDGADDGVRQLYQL